VTRRTVHLSAARPVTLGALPFLILVVIWELLARAHILNRVLLSSPTLIGAAFVKQLHSGTIQRDLTASAIEFAIGFGLSVVVGITVGVVMGWYRPFSYALAPPLWLSYNAPFFALSPLLVVLLGLGTPTVVTVVFLITVVPIVANAAVGVRNVDRTLVRAARSFGATDLQIFRKVALPASVPYVMAGLRLGVGRALVGVIAGEFFGGKAGLGYSISYFAGTLQTDNMMVSVVITAVIGVLLTQGANRLERWLDAWRGWS
jgi:ABC-type nitrate/sulfonate/bicarbonate transport system permease component